MLPAHISPPGIVEVERQDHYKKEGLDFDSTWLAC